MAYKMTSQERLNRMFEHKQADRVPIIDYAWASAVARWHNEGLPPDVDYKEYFGFDCIQTIYPDCSPREKFEIIEDTPEYFIYREWRPRKIVEGYQHRNKQSRINCS